jgi:spore germination protein
VGIALTNRFIYFFVACLLFVAFIPMTGEASHLGNTVKIVNVKTDKAYVYSLPKYTSKKITTLIKGEQYPIIKSSKYYHKILMLGGKTGWIQKKKVEVKWVKRVVMGWNSFGSTDLFIKQGEAATNLHVVSPRWFRLDASETVTISVDTRYVEWAHGQGKKVWPLLGNKFDPVLTDAILSDTVKRQKLVSLLKDSLVQNNLDGINVDFENMDIKNKADFVLFVKELKRAVQSYNKVVSVDVSRENPDPFWSGSYDRRELGKNADYVIMMAYDEHWDGQGKAGSVASLPWVRGGIELLMKEVPAHKIILGVPFYTKEWVTDLSTNKVTGYDRNMKQVEQLIAEKGLQKTWNAAAQQNYIEFIENNEKHQIWVEDRQSMQLRRDLVNKFYLSGVAAWAIGMETPDIWQVFDAYR